MAERRSGNLPFLFGLVWPETDAPEPSISQESWSEIANIARQHRLRPLLHSRCRDRDWQVPPDIGEEWAISYRRSIARSLRQKAELVRITRWFAQAGIAAHVLKGGAMVWRGWFDPPVRPMRDLDLLVPKEQASAAQELLSSRGFTGPKATTFNNSKHLPSLLAPNTNVVVEIHTRLIDPLTPEWARRDQTLCELARSRDRQLPVKDGGFTVFADDDTLLHVIVHAVLDHQFNNGPLLLIDINALVANGNIDWCRFWATAEEIGAMRAAQLALRLAETLMPELTIDWQGHAPHDLDALSVASAAGLMLVPVEKQTELGFIGRLTRFRWSEQSRILIDSVLRKTDLPVSANHAGSGGHPSRPIASLARKIINASNKAGRSHIKRSLDVAKWLRD